MAKKKKKKAAKGGFVCKTCGKSFRMAAHLGRHMSTIHSQKRKAKKPSRPKRAGRVGRPPAIATRFGLRQMGLDELAELIDATKAEARRRLAELQRAFG